MADRRVTIRLSEEEFAAVEAAANKKGSTIAAEIRAAVTAGIALTNINDSLAAFETRLAERLQRIPQASADATIAAIDVRKRQVAQGG